MKGPHDFKCPEKRLTITEEKNKTEEQADNVCHQAIKALYTDKVDLF